MLRCIVTPPVLDRAKAPRFQTYRWSAERWFAGGGINNAGSVTAWCAAAVARAPLHWLEREAALFHRGVTDFGAFRLSYRKTPEPRHAGGSPFRGVRSSHGRAHFYRAIGEGTTFLVRGITEGMRCVGIVMPEMRAAGRGHLPSSGCGFLQRCSRSPSECPLWCT